MNSSEATLFIKREIKDGKASFTCTHPLVSSVCEAGGGEFDAWGKHIQVNYKNGVVRRFADLKAAEIHLNHS